MTEHVKARWFRNEDKLPDGSYIDKYGDVCYIKNGLYHREDGPAKEFADGYIAWYINGNLHREDGPAIERADGRKEWFINGEEYETKEEYEEALKIWKMNKAME